MSVLAPLYSVYAAREAPRRPWGWYVLLWADGHAERSVRLDRPGYALVPCGWERRYGTAQEVLDATGLRISEATMATPGGMPIDSGTAWAERQVPAYAEVERMVLDYDLPCSTAVSVLATGRDTIRVFGMGAKDEDGVEAEVPVKRWLRELSKHRDIAAHDLGRRVATANLPGWGIFAEPDAVAVAGSPGAVIHATFETWATGVHWGGTRDYPAVVPSQELWESTGWAEAVEVELGYSTRPQLALF
jgi:hypothetical protein